MTRNSYRCHHQCSTLRRTKGVRDASASRAPCVGTFFFFTFHSLLNRDYRLQLRRNPQRRQTVVTNTRPPHHSLTTPRRSRRVEWAAVGRGWDVSRLKAPYVSFFLTILWLILIYLFLFRSLWCVHQPPKRTCQVGLHNAGDGSRH